MYVLLYVIILLICYIVPLLPVRSHKAIVGHMFAIKTLAGSNFKKKKRDLN